MSENSKSTSIMLSGPVSGEVFVHHNTSKDQITVVSAATLLGNQPPLNVNGYLCSATVKLRRGKDLSWRPDPVSAMYAAKNLGPVPYEVREAVLAASVIAAAQVSATYQNQTDSWNSEVLMDAERALANTKLYIQRTKDKLANDRKQMNP